MSVRACVSSVSLCFVSGPFNDAHYGNKQHLLPVCVIEGVVDAVNDASQDRH